MPPPLPENQLSLLEIDLLEEARQARGVGEIADESRPITGGGVANRGKPGSWVNYAIGMALDQSVPPLLPPRAELDEIIVWYESAGIEPRFEVSAFVHPAFLKDLESLNFRVRGFESVLFRELAPSVIATTIHPAPPDLSIRVVNPTDPREVRAYCEVALSGFFPPGESPSENDYDVCARCVRHPRTIAVTAWLNGRIVGAGGLEVHEKIAALFGLSVIPEARRLGVQQALIAARLNFASARGVRVATIGSRPGEATERNVRRMGFQIAYTKASLVRPAPGLMPMKT